jgi:tRNA threonylcarbamoyladenosine biosynthesis protein TsaE
MRVPTAARMRALGCRIAALLRPGDLVVLTGPLGAGKTTLVQGIGEGLGVRGPVTSPTFVIARRHPSLRGGPALVHADAYRLGGRAEVDDLDLDADLDSSVTVVEWGEGMVEELASGFLQITIAMAPWPSRADGHADGDTDGDADGPQEAADEPRTVTICGTGDRWEEAAASARLALTGAREVL